MAGGQLLACSGCGCGSHLAAKQGAVVGRGAQAWTGVSKFGAIFARCEPPAAYGWSVLKGGVHRSAGETPAPCHIKFSVLVLLMPRFWTFAANNADDVKPDSSPGSITITSENGRAIKPGRTQPPR